MRDRASDLRAIADGRLMLHVRNGVTVPRSMLAMIADEIDALRAAPLTPAEVGGHADAQTEAKAIVVQVVHEVNGGKPGGHQRAAGIVAAALAAKDAELVEVHQRYIDANEARIDAEAQLAEARKALGMMLREHDILSGNFGDVADPKHRRPDRWPTAAEAARRALKALEARDG